jgi:hypothetical protein
MKNFYLRSCVALACAFGAVACGGSDNDVVLYVSVFGVTKDGLTLTNNGGPPLPVPAGASSVSFPALVGADSRFHIEIASPVSNASCVLNNASGKTGSYSPNNISLVCTVFTYDLGGKIKNLTSDGLVLSNGSDRKTFNNTGASADFNMTIDATATTLVTGKVAEGQPYGVLILQQPTQGTCRIEKDATGASTGVGVMPAAKVESVIVQC